MTLVNVLFHQSSPGFDGNASHQQCKPPSSFYQRIFPLTNLLHFNDLTNLSPPLLMRIWCQIVPLWQNTFAQISHRMILGEGKTTKEKKVYFLLILKTLLIVLVTLWYFKKFLPSACYAVYNANHVACVAWRFCREQYSPQFPGGFFALVRLY